MPKSYLVNFCISGKKEVFRSKFIPQKQLWYKPHSKHIEQICYGQDIYDLHVDIAKTNQVEKDHVERFAFWYEKGFITELINVVEKGQYSEETLQELPAFYLSMILRNPVFRNALNEKQIDELITEEIRKIRVKTAKFFEKGQLDDFKEVFDEKISSTEKELKSQNTKEFIHTTTLFLQHFGFSAGFASLVSMLQGYKILFIKITDKDNFFICSNAPGFSLDVKNQVSSFKFKDDFAHYMPISSKISIALMHPVYHFGNPKVTIVDASDELVSYINQNTLITSNNEVYSQDIETLRKITSVNNGSNKA